jgi:hypothetical protein
MTTQDTWADLGTFLLPGGVIRRVYRGKIQAFIKLAFERGELCLPPDWSDKCFWSQYRQLYRKEWNVKIEERYAHGKGVVLYLARYCKGGPLHPNQLKAMNHKAIDMSYLDHRTQRIKRQRLKPMDFIQRILQHVPPVGLHTVRYYGLYASVSQKRYNRCRKQHGVVSGIAGGHSAQITSMILYCKTCGMPAQLSYQHWPTGKKGISINRGALQDGTGGHVQQVDESGHANVLRTREPYYASG